MATWYCNADTGNDTTGNGSSGNPYLTISKINSVAAAGDEAVLQTSTATFAFPNVNLILGILRGQTLAGAVVDDGGGSDVLTFAHTCAVSNIIWQNAAYSTGSSKMFVVNAALTVSFTNCIVRNVSFTGVNNLFNGAPAIFDLKAGITFNLTRSVIYNITCANGAFTQSNAALFGASAGGAATIALTNLTYHSSAPMYPAFLYAESNVTLNFTHKNSIYSIAFAIASGVENGGAATHAGSNNCFNGWSSPPSLTGDITSDPLFVDAANGNFNLRPTSPCIDAGVVV